MILRLSRLSFLSLVLIVACHGDENRRPTAETMSINVMEDTAASWSLRGMDPENKKLTFRVISNPAHGSLQVDPGTGAFLYAPEADFFGMDSFFYSVFDGTDASTPAVVTLNVENVNDPPKLAEIPDLQNSIEAGVVTYTVVANDVDNEQLTFTAFADDPEVATVEVDPVSGTLQISWTDYGETRIQVTANDSMAGAVREFIFSVVELTKSVNITASPVQAIRLSNATNMSIEFRLAHNNFPMFRSDTEMVKFVHNMPAEFEYEPFERKLWRFVRDNVYHAVPLTAEQWLYDPWVTMNSLGWGFCGHVSAVYVRLARAAGYEARIWGLNGHVVPEIRINERWQMYDPDIAVYYRNRDGHVAGLEELAADPNLITSPSAPVFNPVEYSYPYTDIIGQIYGSTGDNFLGNTTFLAVEAAEYRPVTLPAGASFTYPGRWVESVEGVDGDVPFLVPHFLQAALTIEAGWSGSLVVPWMIWDIQGEGSVNIEGTEFAVGSVPLSDRLRRSQDQISAVEMVAATSPLRFIFFINAMRYELKAFNGVTLSGKDVWGISVATEDLPPENRTPWDVASEFRKPRAAALP